MPASTDTAAREHRGRARRDSTLLQQVEDRLDDEWARSERRTGCARAHEEASRRLGRKVADRRGARDPEAVAVAARTERLRREHVQRQVEELRVRWRGPR